MKAEDYLQVSEEAEYYLPLKTNDKIATLFYKWIGSDLYYHSTCGGGWFISDEKDPRKFVAEDLIKIEA